MNLSNPLWKLSNLCGSQFCRLTMDCVNSSILRFPPFNFNGWLRSSVMRKSLRKRGKLHSVRCLHTMHSCICFYPALQYPFSGATSDVILWTLQLQTRRLGSERASPKWRRWQQNGQGCSIKENIKWYILLPKSLSPPLPPLNSERLVMEQKLYPNVYENSPVKMQINFGKSKSHVRDSFKKDLKCSQQLP